MITTACQPGWGGGVEDNYILYDEFIDKFRLHHFSFLSLCDKEMTFKPIGGFS
jgi:hypothetical protein